MLIDSCPDLRVVAEAADGHEVLGLVRDRHPDVVVMDIRMPGMDGLAATAAIRGDDDLAATGILILTTFETDDHVARALRAGANGFLGKDTDADGLLTAIRTVASGRALLSAHATRLLADHLRHTPAPPDPALGPAADPDRRLGALTAREREVMALAARGHTNHEIAEDLHLSPLTVRTHIHHAMAKLHARDRAQLVALAYQSGLVAAVESGRPQGT